MAHRDSLIKASCAVAVLTAAKESDRATALKLIEDLALDKPAPETSPTINDAQLAALVQFHELAEALQSRRDITHLWRSAERATRHWVDTLV